MSEIEKYIQIAEYRNICDFCPHCGDDDVCIKCQRVKPIAIDELRDFHYTVVQALQEKLERENPKPLTLEELRCMDCEPVYIVRGLHLPCENDEWWAIIHTFQNCEFAHFISHGKKFSADFEDYGVRWLAYRYKPKHIGEATNIVEGE